MFGNKFKIRVNQVIFTFSVFKHATIGITKALIGLHPSGIRFIIILFRPQELYIESLHLLVRGVWVFIEALDVLRVTGRQTLINNA